MTANIRREFADMATVVTAPDVGGGLSTSLGLTTAQATVALKQVGLDQVETTKRFRLVREGLALVANPLVLILIAVNTIRPWPSVLPLIGVARLASARRSRAVVMDFGHTSVKRGVTVYNDGSLAAIEVLEPLDAPWSERVGEGVIQAIATAMRHVGEDLDPTILVSVASSLDRTGRPDDDRSMYSGLDPIGLASKLRQQTGRSSLQVRLCTTAPPLRVGLFPTHNPRR